MSNGVERGEGASRGCSRVPAWLGLVGIAALFAAGCGGSVEGSVGQRGSNATGASSATTPNTATSNAATQSAALPADAVVTSVPSSDPPLSYPFIEGTAPPPPDAGPPPAASSEPPRPTTPAPPVVVVPPNDCRFEYLGDWVVCENAGWPNVTVSSATDLVGCMQECLQHDDCTAVTDYFWLGIPSLGCYLYTSSCDAPVNHPVWAEEDGGRDYRRGACAAAPDAGH